MGVRFECPNGHKLHVKAELAGKRGICPECGVKFVVPSFSGERVAADAGPPSTAAPTPTLSSAAPSGSVIIQTAPPSGITRTGDSENSQAPAVAVAWYIRPAAGGQFGPASTELFQQWITEGRVTADSWVWRTGWSDWKPGSEALALVSDRSPVGVAAAVADSADPLFDNDLLAAGPVESGTAQARRAEIRRRKQRTRTISMILGIVALAVLVALVVVLAR
jgi:hypothetical protein